MKKKLGGPYPHSSRCSLRIMELPSGPATTDVIGGPWTCMYPQKGGWAPTTVNISAWKVTESRIKARIFPGGTLPRAPSSAVWSWICASICCITGVAVGVGVGVGLGVEVGANAVANPAKASGVGVGVGTGVSVGGGGTGVSVGGGVTHSRLNVATTL